MEQKTLIAGRILEDMSDGVLTIDLEGRIVTFNQAAATILGIGRNDAIGRTFAEIFLLEEENDSFNQTLLDAIYDSSATHNRVVDFKNGNSISTLSLTTSFLKGEKGEKAGVIAVFSDITELKTLQETETRLAEELKSKHKELQDAYIKTEQANQQLQSAIKKVQIIRTAATAFTIILFLGIGLFVWNRRPAGLSSTAATATDRSQMAPVTSLAVTPQPLSSAISLTGRILPIQMLNITAPVSGKGSQMLVRYGDLVKAGQPLLVMDTSEAQIKYREARAAYIKALNNYKQMENWDASPDVARAHRSIAKAKLSLENQKKKLDESERLFKKGIIPATEYESDKNQYANQKMDYQSALEELKAANEKGNSDSLKVARFELDNAEARMQQMERDIAASRVVAPASGIVIKPPATGQSKESRTVERGATFQQGEQLLAIGDLSGFSVSGKLDEIDVTKVRLGQKVRVTGDAFPGQHLEGSIQSISPHAEEGQTGQGAVPSFGIRALADKIPPELKKRIMVGMTAHLEIIVYEKPDALMVPITAVHEEQGKRFVIRKKPADPAAPGERIPVTTGYTTQESVEITGGLKPGELIEVPAQSSAPVTSKDGKK